MTAQQLTEFLQVNGMPTAAAEVLPEHVDAFIADQLARNTPSTAATKFAALQQLFKFLVSEKDIPASPMATLKAPKIPNVSVLDHVVADDDACGGT